MDLAEYTTGLGTISKKNLANFKIKIPKDKSLIKSLEPKFKKIESLKEEVEKLDSEYKQYIQELADEAMPPELNKDEDFVETTDSETKEEIVEEASEDEDEEDEFPLTEQELEKVYAYRKLNSKKDTRNYSKFSKEHKINKDYVSQYAILFGKLITEKISIDNVKEKEVVDTYNKLKSKSNKQLKKILTIKKKNKKPITNT